MNELKRRINLIEKRKIYKKYSKFVSVQNIGLYWVGQAKQFLPISYLVQEYTFFQVAAWGLKSVDWWFIHNPVIPVFAIVVFVVAKYYGFMIINWLLGWIVILSGLNKAQADIASKDEHLNPFQSEQINTLKEICKKLEVKHHFTEL